MSGPTEVWKQVADTFDQHYRAISDEQWSASTPCTEWTVRDLVDHAVGVQVSFGGALGSKAQEGADWPDAKAAMESALADPAALEGTINHPAMGEMAKHQVLGIAIGDLLIHSWDLARAIGGDETLPPAAVEAVSMGLANLPPEMLRAPGRFAPAIDVGADASPQDQLLAFAGRQP